LTCQVTLVLLVFATVAENVVLEPIATFADVGTTATVTAGGSTVLLLELPPPPPPQAQRSNVTSHKPRRRGQRGNWLMTRSVCCCPVERIECNAACPATPLWDGKPKSCGMKI
jgi:hypothetical protein